MIMMIINSSNNEPELSNFVLEDSFFITCSMVKLLSKEHKRALMIIIMMIIIIEKEEGKHKALTVNSYRIDSICTNSLKQLSF